MNIVEAKKDRVGSATKWALGCYLLIWLAGGHGIVPLAIWLVAGFAIGPLLGIACGWARVSLLVFEIRRSKSEHRFGSLLVGITLLTVSVLLAVSRSEVQVFTILTALPFIGVTGWLMVELLKPQEEA